VVNEGKQREEKPAGGTGIVVEGGENLHCFCLELEPIETKRALAWVNSICLAFLFIGIIGNRRPHFVIHPRPTVAEEAVPVVIEQLVRAVQSDSSDAPSEEGGHENVADDGARVPVTIDSPSVVFSVPTVGSVLVPLSKAQGPPAHPKQSAVPAGSVDVQSISVTGSGGSRPAPAYPRESLLRHETGTVILLIAVDETGKVTEVSVKEPSGFSRLDHAAADHVKRTWYFGAAAGKRLYECPFVFQLQ
jgi:TonB family protein